MHKFIQNNITKKYLNCQYQITQTRFPRFARAGAKPKNMPLEQQKRHPNFARVALNKIKIILFFIRYQD